MFHFSVSKQYIAFRLYDIAAVQVSFDSRYQKIHSLLNNVLLKSYGSGI